MAPHIALVKAIRKNIHNHTGLALRIPPLPLKTDSSDNSNTFPNKRKLLNLGFVKIPIDRYFYLLTGLSIGCFFVGLFLFFYNGKEEEQQEEEQTQRRKISSKQGKKG